MKILTFILMFVFGGLSLPAADTAPKAKAGRSSATVQALVKTLTPPQQAQLLDLLNKGNKQALLDIPGVGETRASAIIKARPYADVTGVLKVEGVGEGTFAKMVAHVKAGPQR